MPDARRMSPREAAVLYVGTVVPDTSEFRGPAFSPSGYQLQVNLLNGMVTGGRVPVEILSQRPQRLFPRDPTIWQKGGRVELPDGLRVRLLPYVNLPVLRPLTVGITVAVSIWRFARSIRPQPLVVCTYNLSEPPGLLTWLGTRLAGAKAVALVYDVHVPGSLIHDSWLRRLDFALQRWLLPRFDGLVVVNDRIAEDFAPHVPHIRVEGGVSPRMLAVGDRPRRAGDGRFTLVAAGSLHEGNGIAEILEAMRLLPDTRYRLRIAGEGPLEGLIRQAMATDPRIEYCGLLRFEEVLDLYAGADALLNMRITQKIDTRYYFPSKTMEYLASGVPVITTCPGNVREEFSELAFLLDDESPQALARLIASVAAMPWEERDARGRAAREFMAAHRTWIVQGRRIVEFLRGIVR